MKYSKQDAIAHALLRGEALTQRDAIERFGSYRLAAVVCRLRDRGMDILSRNIQHPTCPQTRYTQYRMSVPAAQRDLFA